MFKGSNLHYEMAERVAAVNCGGIGAMHLMVQRLGLVEDIDSNPFLLLFLNTMATFIHQVIKQWNQPA